MDLILQSNQKFYQVRKLMERDPLVIPNKSCKAYFLLSNGAKVYFSGDFDSGNLQKVQQLSQSTYRVTPAFDKTRNTTNKNFFHFKVHGFKQSTIKFIVTRAYILEPLIKGEGSSDVYRPVVKRYPHTSFERINQSGSIYYNSADEPELAFSFTFQHQNWVEFAFVYPYSYQQCEQVIYSLAQHYRNHSDIYLHRQTLIKTSQTRKVHLLTITDRRNLGREKMDLVQGILEEDDRPFKIDRPRIVISARVHPGQTPASHCMEGVLRFLTNEKDYRSYLLRKYFQFCLIPMVNPEGVYEGMFRNDLNGQNLNRLYVHCDHRKHKSIWGIKKWIESLDRVDFFFDLHAHPSRKGFFIYGNAFDQILQQVEAQIFSKMLEYNCPYFQNLDCIYSQKAMSAKDKYDVHTKEGCARVHYYNKFKLIHSYTVECGYFAPTKLNRYPLQRQFIVESQYLCTEDWQKVSMKQYTPQSYMFMGKSLLISVLDLFHVNPFSRISTSDFKSINSLRKFTAQRIYNEVERFRLIDANCFRKIKDIANLVEQHYYIPRFKQYGLTINENYGMRRHRKAFSLNARIYRQKQRSSATKQYNNEGCNPSPGISHLPDASLQYQIISKAQNKPLSSIQSLPELKAHKALKSLYKRTTKSSSLANLEKDKAKSQKQRGNLFIANRQDQEIGYALHSRLLSLKQQEAPEMKKIEREIIKQIVKQKEKEKGKRQKKVFESQGAIKIDRIQTFLKKENRVRLPSIQLEPTNK